MTLCGPKGADVVSEIRPVCKAIDSAFSTLQEALSRQGMTVSVGIPYTALADQLRKDAQQQKDDRLDGHFSATGHVGHRYIDRSGQFLHSPDARCIRMEQSFLQERAAKGLKVLSDKHRNNRKHWLKKHNQKMADVHTFSN